MKALGLVSGLFCNSCFRIVSIADFLPILQGELEVQFVTWSKRRCATKIGVYTSF